MILSSLTGQHFDHDFNHDIDDDEYGSAAVVSIRKSALFSVYFNECCHEYTYADGISNASPVYQDHAVDHTHNAQLEFQDFTHDEVF